ncbi:hypothetical protein M0R45_001996 [Rubus argutus]|uniref:Uncharacterized protein n=1 Tax=Rubus argutus TaxID=59490 RepID=A0AAW1VKL2_RUBAR
MPSPHRFLPCPCFIAPPSAGFSPRRLRAVPPCPHVSFSFIAVPSRDLPRAYSSFVAAPVPNPFHSSPSHPQRTVDLFPVPRRFLSHGVIFCLLCYEEEEA